MKAAYFDCFSGIAGDMIVGALLDAGLSLEELKAELNKLNLDGWRVEAKKVKKHGITGTKFIVHVEHHHHDYEHHHHHHRNLHHIRQIINGSTLDQPVKETALKIFERLAAAEAKVHDTTVDQIHFHEVGALDAIIDIVGAAVGLYKLGVEKVISSPLTTGTGFVHCAHGIIPVPAPATVELLQGVPCRHGDIQEEMVTPTGAAILTTVCTQFEPMPEMVTSAVGYGSGERELPIPNLLRVHIGELKSSFSSENDTDTVQVIEANIDDMNPEFYSAAVQRLLDSGALDVYISPVLMKKGRPGTVLHLIAPPGLEQRLGQILLEETTTIGYRSYTAKRRMLERELVPVKTRYGTVRVKVARQQDKILNIAPEYEDCLQAAKLNGVPVKLIYNTAIEEFANKRRI
ncbi:uncharacterized protein (TIGR00299 family) protein [Desulfohalotomaculum tongense]|uniref:nickel pincer cofactor biosynthesis protein LarC n=1 Tax=Desulforadius tongensis TaxID=1216062 RepID=UPI00195B835A|nr:nickel pincer cofactor biosynthesis protein LarC [Desulforadius tongensis]MBM7855314.1 uncharacterized protein (TIGR00299 family) protein [Desulforadius tongensis]